MAKEIQKAAIKCGYKIYTGFEHGECFKQIEDCDKDSETIQGFVTNDGDFVNRHEAMVIAKIAGQLQYEMDKETLISEDLHVDWLHKQEKLISKLQSELDYAKKSIEIFKITNDTLQQENLDLSYNQVDNVYELAKEMSENWERDYQQEILELKERLANCIEPKFKQGDYLYSVEKSGSQILLAEGYVTTITQLDDGSIWYHLSVKPHEFGVRETTCYKTMDEVHKVSQKLLKEIDDEQNNRKS